jgi:hypothetical protein
MFAFKSCSMFYKSIACPKSTIKQTQNTGNDFVIQTLGVKSQTRKGVYSVDQYANAIQ